MGPRFLVYLPAGERPHLHVHSIVVYGDSREAVAEHFLPFASFTIFDLERERPDWLTDRNLEALETHHAYELGAPEPGWLSNLLDHLVNGDTYRWYRLLELTGNREIPAGEFGSWGPKGAGSILLLPGSQRMAVAAVRPSAPPFDSELVLVAAS